MLLPGSGIWFPNQNLFEAAPDILPSVGRPIFLPLLHRKDKECPMTTIMPTDENNNPIPALRLRSIPEPVSSAFMPPARSMSALAAQASQPRRMITISRRMCITTSRLAAKNQPRRFMSPLSAPIPIVCSIFPRKTKRRRGIASRS